jgi:hypothetical protein
MDLLQEATTEAQSVENAEIINAAAQRANKTCAPLRNNAIAATHTESITAQHQRHQDK